MGSKVKTAPQETIDKSSCRHYWVIESPRGATSRGVCKFCGAEKEFQNFMPDSLSKGNQPSSSRPSSVEDTEPDMEEDDTL